LFTGINQQNQSEASLKKDWLGFLNAAVGPANTLNSIECLAPYYGDCLAGVDGGAAGSVIAQGTDGKLDTDEAAFLAAALTEQAQAAGIGARAIAAEERAQLQESDAVTEQGFPMDRRLNAILRVLEKVSPLHGGLCMRVLKQAYDYLKRPGIAGRVDAIVRPIIDAGPAVIVGHSLGTVVTFKILRQLALERRPIKVPLHVTLGSPLPLMAVQAALGPAFSVPSGVAHWINAVDPDDLISLGRGLDELSFAAGIDNILDIRNIAGDPHAIQGYIGNKRVANAIVAACRV
jgi:hypothetical protein